MTTPTATKTLPKSYTPAEVEPEIRLRWEASGAFHAEPAGSGDERPSYCILIPPPNVTAALHLGHAFNNTLQDVLTRFHRMRGFRTLWMPGTDHAGIATQTVVEKRLIAEGRKRTDFAREDFVARVQEWKDEYEATITEQLKTMGCSCDWDRQRFTMDDMCAAAVREAFFRLFSAGLVYRGKRLVNWDPVTRTALADDEVEMKEVQGSMWYLRYPVEEETPKGRKAEKPKYVVVATTRPETMLGDTAVAINPKDPRAATLRGKMVRLPLVDRVVPIVEDDFVVLSKDMGGDPSNPKAEYATGFLKVTPGHDPNDWEIGRRHGLALVNVLAPDATISDQHGWDDCVGDARQFVGMSREDARAAVVEWFKARDLLEGVREYTHSVGHSYRSHVPIEPYLSDQWYVKVSDDALVGEAQRALADEQFEGQRPARRGGGARQGDGALTFHPARYARMYQGWHENLRDWCISRQLWWGHRIPVWTGPRSAAGDLLAGAAEGAGAVHVSGDAGLAFIESETDPEIVHVCVSGDAALERRLEDAGFSQDPDVLDTWFSSGLWPLSTMGWPDPAAHPETVGLLETFNPTSVLCTGRDIITLWVSRMVMFNRFFNDGHVPYREVYIHPMIQDGHGQRMSKSLGNGVDPRNIIHRHGADAMRFTLAQMATSTQDARLPVDMVCPHCGADFHPAETTSPAGYRVAAPEQACPKCGKGMVSGYGAAIGATVTDAVPVARNTSTKFDLGRNFCNKVWNATRFALGNLTAEPAADNGERALVDRWILTRLHRTLHAVEDALGAYQFSVYADAMYDFVWRDFCDWYLEAVKPTIRENARQQQVLRTVLNAALRLLHPICPFVTEALWPHVAAAGRPGLDGIRLAAGDLLAAAPWPDIDCSIDDDAAHATFERAQALVNLIRTARSEHGVPPRKQVGLVIPVDLGDFHEAVGGILASLAGLDDVRVGGSAGDGAIVMTFEGRELHLTGVAESVDIESEKARLEKVVDEKQRAVRGLESRLANPGYVSKAPPHLVEETRANLTQAEADLAAALKALKSLVNGP